MKKLYAIIIAFAAITVASTHSIFSSIESAPSIFLEDDIKIKEYLAQAIKEIKEYESKEYETILRNNQNVPNAGWYTKGGLDILNEKTIEELMSYDLAQAASNNNILQIAAQGEELIQEKELGNACSIRRKNSWIYYTIKAFEQKHRQELQKKQTIHITHRGHLKKGGYIKKGYIGVIENIFSVALFLARRDIIIKKCEKEAIRQYNYLITLPF